MIENYLDKLKTARKYWDSGLFEKVLANERNNTVSNNYEFNRLNSKFAKSIKSKGRTFFEVYNQMLNNPELLEQLDDLNVKQKYNFIVNLKRLKEINDLQYYGSNLSDVASEVKQELLFILGIHDVKDDMNPIEKIRFAIRSGQKYWGR